MRKSIVYDGRNDAELEKFLRDFYSSDAVLTFVSDPYDDYSRLISMVRDYGKCVTNVTIVPGTKITVSNSRKSISFTRVSI